MQATTIVCIICMWFTVVNCDETSRNFYVDVKPSAVESGVRESVLTTPLRVNPDRALLQDAKIFRNRDQSDGMEYESDNEDFVSPHYLIDAFDQQLVVSLEKYQTHMAPAYTTTYTNNKDSENVMASRHGLSNCFYKGSVVGVPDSIVSVSICGGLTGTIRTNGFEYTIKPTNESLHTIHRRSIAASHSTPCAVNDKRHKRSYQRTFIQDVEAITTQLRQKRSVLDEENKMEEEFAESGESRKKRSFMSRQHYIETMIVADKSMADHHGSDLEHYILTVAMVANQVFSHGSLGNAVSLSVVRIMVIDNEHEGPRVSTNAARTLHDFCEWQRKFNTPDDSDPNHYDLAILMTRRDLCGDTCDTLGMAEVGAMCSSRHSCAVVEEDGLSTAYTVAHEAGHVLNMMHDDNPLCRANFGNMNPDSHIMSSTMNQIDAEQPWSMCSRKAITDFLESGRGECLYDEPQKPKVYPTSLPGAMYDINAQCEMAFGPGARECTFMNECGRLWCHTPSERNQCHTRHFPRADGSSCGRGLHCFQGKCTRADEVREPQDGQWSKWGVFGTCSRTCGGGVQMSSRECNNPKPQHGGKFCTGTRLRFRSCNTLSCPMHKRSDGTKYQPDFRAEQCADYNNQAFPTLGIMRPSTWIPKYTNVHADDRCKLLCQSTQTGSYVSVSEKVVDGTRCGPDTTDVCVQGHCMKAGCDGVLGSSAAYDKCGVCKGGNANCKRVKGSYNKKLQGYNDVIVIPKGAASIDILQRGYRNKMHDGNYLSLRDQTGRYLLNGGLTLTTIKKDLDFDGTILRYTGVGSSNERIIGISPINSPLTVQVLSLGLGTTSRINPPRIKYCYYIKKSRHSRRKSVSVSTRKSSNKVLKIQSQEQTKVEAKPFAPKPSGEEPLPPDAANLRWVTGRWTKCRAKFQCSGWKVRKVTCKDNRGKTAIGCRSMVKPYERLPCIVTSCSKKNPSRNNGGGITTGKGSSSGPIVINQQDKGIWTTRPWGMCSKICGVGRKVRYVRCRSSSNRLLSETLCDKATKPASSATCKIRDCKG